MRALAKLSHLQEVYVVKGLPVLIGTSSLPSLGSLLCDSTPCGITVIRQRNMILSTSLCICEKHVFMLLFCAYPSIVFKSLYTVQVFDHVSCSLWTCPAHPCRSCKGSEALHVMASHERASFEGHEGVS